MKPMSSGFNVGGACWHLCWKCATPGIQQDYYTFDVSLHGETQCLMSSFKLIYVPLFAANHFHVLCFAPLLCVLMFQTCSHFLEEGTISHIAMWEDNRSVHLLSALFSQSNFICIRKIIQHNFYASFLQLPSAVIFL